MGLNTIARKTQVQKILAAGFHFISKLHPKTNKPQLTPANWGFAVYVGYDCNGYNQKGLSVCSSFRVKAQPLEDRVVNEVRLHSQKLAGEFNLAALIKRDIEAVFDTGSRQALAGVKTDLEGIEKQIKNLADLMAMRPNVAPFLRKFDELEAQRVKLREFEEELSRQIPAEAMDVEAMASEMLSYLDDFPKVMAEGTMEEKKLMAREFIERVEVDRKAGEARFVFYKLPGLQKGIADRFGVGDSSHRNGCGGGI